MELNIELKQAHILSQQQIQSMEILHMSAEELLERISAELTENPALEEEPANPSHSKIWKSSSVLSGLRGRMPGHGAAVIRTFMKERPGWRPLSPMIPRKAFTGLLYSSLTYKSFLQSCMTPPVLLPSVLMKTGIWRIPPRSWQRRSELQSSSWKRLLTSYAASSPPASEQEIWSIVCVFSFPKRNLAREIASVYLNDVSKKPFGAYFSKDRRVGDGCP